MNKLTPKERKRITAMQIAKDVYPSRPGTAHIKAVGLELAIKKYAAQEVAEAKNKMWTDGGNVIITFDEYNLLKKEVAEKDELLGRAVKLLQKAYQKVNAKNRADRGAIAIEIKDFLTELKQRK